MYKPNTILYIIQTNKILSPYSKKSVHVMVKKNSRVEK